MRRLEDAARGVGLLRVRRDVDGLDGRPGGDRLSETARPLEDERAFGASHAALAEEPSQTLDPLVAQAERRVVQEAASVARSSSARRAAATATMAENAFGSRTARSARTLRSTSTSALLSPAMRRE